MPQEIGLAISGRQKLHKTLILGKTILLPERSLFRATNISWSQTTQKIQATGDAITVICGTQKFFVPFAIHVLKIKNQFHLVGLLVLLLDQLGFLKFIINFSRLLFLYDLTCTRQGFLKTVMFKNFVIGGLLKLPFISIQPLVVLLVNLQRSGLLFVRHFWLCV